MVDIVPTPTDLCLIGQGAQSTDGAESGDRERGQRAYIRRFLEKTKIWRLFLQKIF
jgi:hypothetical protein